MLDTKDMREINNQSGTGDKNLPKCSTDDETIGGESVCGRIEGRSPSCTRSGHELQKHIRRTPYHQKNNNETHARGERENELLMSGGVILPCMQSKRERPNHHQQRRPGRATTHHEIPCDNPSA